MVSSAHCTAVRIDVLTRRGRGRAWTRKASRLRSTTVAAQAVELAKRLGADQAEAGVSYDEGLSVTVRMGELESVERQRDRGLARHRLSRRAEGQREHDRLRRGAASRRSCARRSASAASRRRTSTRASPTRVSWPSIRPTSSSTSRGISTSTARPGLRCAPRTPRAGSTRGSRTPKARPWRAAPATRVVRELARVRRQLSDEHVFD